MRGLNIYASIVAAVLVGLALAIAVEADEKPVPTPPPQTGQDIVLMPSCAQIAYSVSRDDKTKTVRVICSTIKKISM